MKRLKKGTFLSNMSVPSFAFLPDVDLCIVFSS